MGKPIKKSWFGEPVGPGSNHIRVNGVKFADGVSYSDAFIVKQTGSSAYIVQDSAQIHAPEIVFMVNASSISALNTGECFILATPFGGSPVPCSKIAQYRVDVFENGTVVSYTWSTRPAVALGQADLINMGPAGQILSFQIINGGRGYTSVPTVTISSPPGTGATGWIATVVGGVVTAITGGNPGSGYATDATATIAAPAAAVTATATATVNAGAFTGIASLVGGNYYSVAPIVTIGGPGTGASATAIINASGAVTGITNIVGGSGYTSATITFAAPPASVTATAIPIVS
jgi:hypothetical protein